MGETQDHPSGWESCQLGDLISLNYGKALPAKTRDPNGDYEVFGSNGAVGVHSKALIPGPAIIVGRKGSAGKVDFSREPCWPIDTTYFVHPPDEMDIRFTFFLLKSLSLDRLDRSTAVPGLNRDDAYAQNVGLPPTSEQQRIVEKIETLFARLDKGEEAVREVQKLLTRYRQSVLKSAVTGQLTADWRAERKGELEDGLELLTRVLERRRDTWSGRGKYKPAVEPEADMLPALPSNWAWGTLDQLVAGRARSMQSGPFGSSLKHSEFTDHGILVVGIDNVRDGSFSMGSDNRISPDKYKELEKYTARSGDLLVTVMASLGRTCVIPEDLETAIITKHVYRISMEQDLVAPEFYNVLLQTEWVSRRRMFENAQGQTRPGLNSSILRALPVPIFSREEQLEILKRLNVELTAISQLEAKVETELKRSASLRQSILKDAFAGRLVPQDPSDEPASTLLARITEAKTNNKERTMKTVKKAGR